MNTTPKILWTRPATVAANIHDLTQGERQAVEARSIASVNGITHVLAVDVIAVVRARKAVAA